jgi:DtxR family Mn-dependent transcriptional regulator
LSIRDEVATGTDPAAVSRSTSESEEMFLITVARAIEDGHSAPVPLPFLAESLSISRVSATEMAKKLVGRGFIGYEPYHGVTLTRQGTAIANSVLRRRRLWALFLAEHLGLTPAVADIVACEFEHITPGEVAGRLADFLGDPRVGPGGKPIPAADTAVESKALEMPLNALEAGHRGRVTRLAGDAAIRSFLVDEGLTEGVEVTLLAIGSDQGCLIETARGRVHLSATVASSVAVSPVT